MFLQQFRLQKQVKEDVFVFVYKQHAHAEIVTVTVAVLIQIKLAIVNNLKLFTISQIVHNFSNSSL